MYVSRVVIQNYRNFLSLDVSLQPGVTCIIGENNTGKTNLLRAIRLAIDARLPPVLRRLHKHDLHTALSFREAAQILVAVELSDFEGDDNEAAMAAQWSIGPNVARLTYRYRPKPSVIDEIESNERSSDGLEHSDYGWELTGGGDGDPVTLGWDDQIEGGTFVNVRDLEDLNVTLLPPLRDVELALRRQGTSPLRRLVEGLELSEEEQTELVEIIEAANEQVEQREPISDLGEEIQQTFEDATGPAFGMGIRIGVSPTSFRSIASSLSILLSDDAVASFEPSRNGLGLNNILYISLLLENFRRRNDKGETAGALLLFEEPEAHLHPELQEALHTALERSQTQALLTTHSTHVCAKARLDSYVVLTRSAGASTGTVPSTAPGLDDAEARDIERYLDATRSRMLLARAVLLVEGAAEQFCLPALASALGRNLDGLGIAVVPIHGTHFSQYAKLFSDEGLPKRCAVLADGDREPGSCYRAEDQRLATGDDPHASLRAKWVKTFCCSTTFERAVTTFNTLPMIADAARDAKSSKALKKVNALAERVRVHGTDDAEAMQQLHEVRGLVLKLAKRVGKGRFGQLMAKRAHKAEGLPRYVENALDYLVQ